MQSKNFILIITLFFITIELFGEEIISNNDKVQINNLLKKMYLAVEQHDNQALLSMMSSNGLAGEFVYESKEMLEKMLKNKYYPVYQNRNRETFSIKCSMYDQNLVSLLEIHSISQQIETVRIYKVEDIYLTPFNSRHNIYGVTIYKNIKINKNSCIIYNQIYLIKENDVFVIYRIIDTY